MVVYIKCQEKQTPLVKIFLSPAPYIKPTEVICEEAQREVFDLIQEIIFWWCFKKYDTTLDVPIIDIKES